MRAVYWAFLLIALGFSALAQTYQELDDRGYQEFSRGNYPAALEAFSQSLELKRAQLGPENPLTGVGYVSLGLVYMVLNQYPAALERFQMARQILEEALGPGHPVTGQVYLYLGDLYALTDDYPNARAFYDLAGHTFATALGPENPSSALLLTKTSLLYTRLGDLPKALQDALEAVRIYEKTQGALDPATAAAYEQAAYVYFYLADGAHELEYLKKALFAREKANGAQSLEVADVLKNLGEIYQRRGDYPLALESLGKAQAIYEAALGPSHPKTALLYTSLGRIYGVLKDYIRAVDLLQKALPVLTRAFGPESLPVATVDMELGNLYLELNDYPRALEALQQALPIHLKNFGPNNINTAINYSALGAVYLRQNDFVRALEWYRQGFAAFFAQQALAFSILDNAGKLRYKNQNQVFASGMLSAISQLEGASLTQRQQVLDDWLSFKGSAFAFENGLSLLQQRASPELKALLEQYLTLRRELAGLYTRTPEDEASARATQGQIATRAEELARLERDLSGKIQAFAELLSLQRIHWSDLARQLRPGELYLDYAWTDKTLFALTLDAGGEVGVYLLGTTPEVAAQVSALRTAIEGGKPLEALVPTSQALYGALIRPLEGRLASARTLVVSPDGPLAFLPFELLSDGSRLLLERYVIRYTPTGRDLIRLRLNPSPDPAGPAAVFGNPSFSAGAPAGSRSSPSRSLAELLRNANLGALPGTEAEAQAVAALLGGQTRVFLGEAANEQNLFGLQSPRVLHLATHGFFVNDPDIPNPLLRVGIALAGAKASVAAGEQYGLLTALQLAALNLRGTRLVVLSACETGLGDVVAGEGVAGLNQAFLTAGARGIVLSLWKVPDRETGLLMERFYQLWTSGKPEAEALREAKLELRGRGLAPWYWAAFLLSGE